VSLCLAGLTVACGAHAAGPTASATGGPTALPTGPGTGGSAPLMSVSVAQGKVGTEVSLTVTGCPARAGGPDQITWQGAASAGSTPMPRMLAGVQRAGDVLHASFTVLAADPPGQGIFDAVCGRDAEHASTSFTVLRP
jgi:hypothetical protein